MSRVENEDYELIPVSVWGNDQAWDVRLLTGEFSETVIRYGNVALDGESDQMTFNFKVISSPIPDLSSDDVDLQDEAADTLVAIIEQSIADESMVIKDKGTPIDQ